MNIKNYHTLLQCRKNEERLLMALLIQTKETPAIIIEQHSDEIMPMARIKYILRKWEKQHVYKKDKPNSPILNGHMITPCTLEQYQ